MLDLHLLRERPELVVEGLKKRGQVPALDELQALDAKRRALLVETEGLKRKRNESSKEIGQIMKGGGDATALRAEMKAVGERVAAVEAEGAGVDEALADLMKRLP